tara:strand:+ start:1810 stop:2154 length:345 start_codon:yes stop_codon:yes gene_type:complete
MKISVKNGRLMAIMAAMILIIGIFIIGKMLGYGSSKNIYLMEYFDEEKVEEDSMEEFGDVSGGVVTPSGDVIEPASNHTQDSSGVEGFGCGRTAPIKAKPIPGFDLSESIYASF